MLTSSSVAAALDAVAQLDHEINATLQQMAMIAARTVDDARVLWVMRRSLEQSMSAVHGIREALVVVVGASDEDLEVVLRERTAAVIVRLTELALAERDVEFPAGLVYVGKFRHLIDVNTHVLERMSQISEDCTRARLAARRVSDSDEGEHAHRRLAYRRAILDAERAFNAIGFDPDLVHFLRAGALYGSATFSAACRAITRLFEVM